MAISAKAGSLQTQRVMGSGKASIGYSSSMPPIANMALGGPSAALVKIHFIEYIIISHSVLLILNMLLLYSYGINHICHQPYLPLQILSYHSWQLRRYRSWRRHHHRRIQCRGIEARWSSRKVQVQVSILG